MYSGRFVYSQLMEFFPLRAFRQCVQRYRGNYKVQHFSCLDQFLCMAFAQLTGRESLRDIETCLRALQPKLYQLNPPAIVLLLAVAVLLKPPLTVDDSSLAVLPSPPDTVDCWPLAVLPVPPDTFELSPIA